MRTLLPAWGGLALLCTVYWVLRGWQWVGPPPLPAPVVARVASAPGAMGDAQGEAYAGATWAPLLLAAGAAPNAQPPEPSQWRLLGGVWASSGAGVAVFASPQGEQVLARASEALAPGLVLWQVQPDHVLLGATEQSAVKVFFPVLPQ